MRAISVVYLSYDGLTDPLGQSQILPYVIGLSKVGYLFTIISFEKPEAFNRNREIIEKICSEHGIQWLPLKYHKRPPVVSTLYDIWTLWRVLKRQYLQGNADIIHCRSYITSLVGLRAKRKWNVKFIFDMRGFWADERVEGALWNLDRPLYKLIYRFFKKKENQFLREADHVVSLTHNARTEIESWRIGNAPITVIPTCVDTELFDPRRIDKSAQEELRGKLGIPANSFVLLYLGSWGTWYLTQEMLDFFAVLKEVKPDSVFLILTTDKVDLSSYKYQADVIVSRVSRAQVPLHISIADASICFIKPTFSKKASAATKMGEILAMRVPVIVNTGWGDVTWLKEHDRAVILLDEITRHGYGNVLNQLFLRPAEQNSDLITLLSLEKAIENYQNIYSSIL